MSDDEIDVYCGTGEPSELAGAFSIDALGGWFIRGIDGDHHNVVGLSLPTLRDMLRAHGFALTDIGYPNR